MALLEGSARRAWSAFLDRLHEDPRDLASAVGVVCAAEKLGTVGAALEQIAGMRRRADTPALQIAMLELAREPENISGSQPRFAGTGGEVAAYRALLRMSRAVAEGDLAGALRSLGSLRLRSRDGRVPASDRLGSAWTRRVHLRRQQLMALISGRDGLRRGLVRQRSRARAAGAAHHATRLDLLLAVSAAADSEPATSRTHAKSALAQGLRAGRNASIYMALTESLSAENPRSHWTENRFPARLCGLIEPRLDRLLRDCLLTAFDHAWKAGEFDAALGVHRVLSAMPRAEHPVLEVRRAMLTVPLLETLGDYEQAASMAEPALRVAEELGDSATSWRLRWYLARLARQRGAEREAMEWLGEAMPRPAVPVPVRVGVEIERGRIVAALGQPEEATRYLDRALNSARPHSEALQQLVTLARMQLDGLSDSQMREARGHEGLLALAERSPVDALSREVVHGQLAAKRGELSAARAHYRAAMRWIADVVRAVGDRRLRQGLVVGWRHLSEEHARIALALGNPEVALDGLETLGTSPRPALHVTEHLENGDKVLVFRRLGEELWCWSLSRDGVDARRVAMPPERLRESLGLWSALLRRGGEASVRDEVGARLSRVLLGSLERHAARRRGRLIIVAGGALARIPFDVLPAGFATGVLGDHYVISRAGSLALLDATWHRAPRDGPAVAFGPSGSAAVLTELATALERRQGLAFMGPRATETRFVQRAERSSLIHFGGHAVPPGDPSRPEGLLLRSSLIDDGLLRYREIVDLDLRGASVVLLGCDTVSSGRQGEDDPPGAPATLAQAFLIAGSRSVVGSLWPLSEAAAEELAKAFYSAGGPEVGPVSLAIAKRVLRRRYPDAPERWAGAVWEGAPVGTGR